MALRAAGGRDFEMGQARGQEDIIGLLDEVP
jgi:hypothetical protein